MNLLITFEILGWLLIVLAGFECVPIAGALVFGEPVLPYAASAAAALVYGVPLVLSTRTPNRRLRPRDGFVVVTGAWVLASAFGALPYYLGGSLSLVDSLFESVAGFTTTGSTVMTRIEEAPRALLLWRSLTQWLGGMGIIVFTIAVLPLLGIGGMQLFRAEVPGPVTDKLTPRVAVTARRLWMVYLGFTLAAFVALVAAGMGAFDALCHAFTALATGGFSTRDASIGAFQSAAIDWILIACMLVAGTNFALHYRVFTGRAGDALRDGELRLYLFTAAGLAATAAWLTHDPSDATASTRSAVFHVVSLLTTTGYATGDYALWPALGQFLVFPMLVLGGMAGSTSGGIKTLRVLIGLRALRTFVLRVAHPLAVRPVRYAGRPVDDTVVSGIAVFFLAYFSIATAAAAVVAASGYDPVTAFSAALTAIGNVGPGLGDVGPTHTFAPLPGVAKLALSFCMIAGRLEVFTVLVLFEPLFWRR